MRPVLENRFYYLDNFTTVLEWVDARYGDLLNPLEIEFVQGFRLLPRPAQALLVRMVMRKGDLFRSSKLRYPEIGSPISAMGLLARQGWIDTDPLMTLDELFGLLTKAEISIRFKRELKQAASTTLDKAAQLASLRPRFNEALGFKQWCEDSTETVCRIRVTALCERIRLMFFGNLRQDWSEFVLSDLGLSIYETVEFPESSRAFHTRDDLDSYLHLYQCRERLASFLDARNDDAGGGDDRRDAIEAIQKLIPSQPYANSWLEARRARLLFKMGQYHERAKRWEDALHWYRVSSHPEARVRAIRVLERGGQFEQAYQLADAACRNPAHDAERQQLSRIMPRVALKASRPWPTPTPPHPVPAISLNLPPPPGPFSVEAIARDHLSRQDAPVYYVENTLINALFGLLCWDAVFAAVPGAFFHPFQSAPADLFDTDFRQHRQAVFNSCLARLDSDQYKRSIMDNFVAKRGRQSAFVAWDLLDDTIITRALECIPAAHLKAWFERILLDIRHNRSGLPDLIQFWPDDKRYRLIEVKGPGDRLQDNQRCWLEYCLTRDMPVAVCHVQWLREAAA